MQRARGRCEICGGDRCGPAQWSHLFGRGGKIAEPWCSWPELTIMAGMECHTRLDANELDGALELLRWQAVERMRKRTGAILPFTLQDPGWTALRAMRWIVEGLGQKEKGPPRQHGETAPMRETIS